MRISDWSSDVCSSDLDMIAVDDGSRRDVGALVEAGVDRREIRAGRLHQRREARDHEVALLVVVDAVPGAHHPLQVEGDPVRRGVRSEEHTSELQSLMRISYAVFCLKKNKKTKQ